MRFKGPSGEWGSCVSNTAEYCTPNSIHVFKWISERGLNSPPAVMSNTVGDSQQYGIQNRSLRYLLLFDSCAAMLHIYKDTSVFGSLIPSSNSQNMCQLKVSISGVQLLVQVLSDFSGLWACGIRYLNGERCIAVSKSVFFKNTKHLVNKQSQAEPLASQLFSIELASQALHTTFQFS